MHKILAGNLQIDISEMPKNCVLSVSNYRWFSGGIASIWRAMVGVCVRGRAPSQNCADININYYQTRQYTTSSSVLALCCKALTPAWPTCVGCNEKHVGDSKRYKGCNVPWGKSAHFHLKQTRELCSGPFTSRELASFIFQC